MPERFVGITQFNDNQVVDRYVNMIPMGNLCVDRLGCDKLDLSLNNSGGVEIFKDVKSSGEFVDSYNNIWFIKQIKDSSGVWNTYLIRYANNTLTSTELVELQGKMITNKVSFVESTTTPKRIYFLVTSNANNYLYATTTNTVEYIETPPGFQKNIYTSTPDNLVLEPVLASASKFSTLSFYDGRLVFTDTANNVTWLSSIDFWDRIQYTKNNPDNTEGIEGRWGKAGSDLAFPHWYGAQNNSDILNDVASFGGQLYMFFSRSIERWVRTGIEDAPIQINTNGTVTVGGKSPVAINDILWFIANDQLGNVFCGRFNQSGGFERVSSNVIEKIINNNIVDINLLLQRQDSFCTLTSKTTSKLCVDKNGFWWEYTTDRNEYPDHTLFGDLAITNKGNLCRFTEEHRRDIDGRPTNRCIREQVPTADTPQRMRIHSIVVTCDTGTFTGKITRDDPQKDQDDVYNSLYCRVSTDRGMRFGAYYYRRLGATGHNDKIMIFRNLGSCNNLVYEVGTSTDTKFQIYNIKADLK